MLPSRAQAQAKAEAWVRRYAELLTGNPALPAELRSLRLAPSQVKPQDLMALANSAGNGYDH